jgi:hypothetical protein
MHLLSISEIVKLICAVASLAGALIPPLINAHKEKISAF